MSVAGTQSSRRRLFGHSAQVYTGKMTRAALSFGISWVLARWLGPRDFGLYYLFITTVIFGQTIMGEGFDPGVVREYARAARRLPSQANRVISSALAMRLAFGIPMMLLCWVIADVVDERLLQSPDYVLPVRLGLVGALGATLWCFTLAVLQAKERFRAYALMTPAVNVLLGSAVLLLIASQRLVLASVLYLNVICLFLATGVGWWMLRRALFHNAVDWSIARELVRFGKWPAFANLFFLLQLYLAVPTLTYFAGASTAGIYSAALTLLLVVDQLTTAILTVQLPEVSKLPDLQACRAHVRRLLPVYSTAALVLSPAILFARPLILFVYGPEYAAGVPVFQILLAGFLVSLAIHPLHLVFYAVNRPYLYTVTAAASLLTWVAVGAVLIPAGGAVGAAWTTLASRLIQSALIAALLWWALRPESPLSEPS